MWKNFAQKYPNCRHSPPRHCKLLAGILAYTLAHQVLLLNHTAVEGNLLEWKTGIQLYFVQYGNNIPIHFKFSTAAKIFYYPTFEKGIKGI